MISRYLAILNKNRLRKEFEDGLPLALEILANSLKAGSSILQALNMVVKETPSPVSEEFSNILKEVQLGIPLDKTLNNLADKIDSSDLRIIVTAILITRETGGNLSEILINLKHILIKREKLRKRMETLTAQGKMSGIVMSILPIILLSIIWLLDSTFLQPLFTTTIGWILLIVALFMEIIGFFIIQQIVRIDV